MVHIHDGILLSHKKEHLWASSNEVDEPRSQKEKDKYHIIIHIYRIYKNGTEEFTYRATMGKQT